MMKDWFANIPRQALMCVIMGGVFVLAACSGGGNPPPGSASENGAGPVTPVTTPTSEDVVWLAKLMASEAGSISDGGQAVRATDTERSAVAWTALNRVKAGTFGKSVHDVVTAPGQFAYGKEPTSEILDLAGRLLKGQIPDPTSGATHFFSPIGMPKEGESTGGFDVGGGLHVVPGLGKKVYFPLWTTKLAWVGELRDVRQKYYMFYRPSGPSPSGGPGVGGSSQARVVFQSRDRSRIFIANADGTGIRLIANGDNPIWSPDGEKLAYTTAPALENSNYVPGRLWLLTSRGKPVELLGGDTEVRGAYVAFAADSDHLVFAEKFSSVFGTGDIYVAKSDGTSKVKLGKHAGTTPAWSPDGSRIAYVNEFYNLVVVNNDGTQTQRLVTMPNTQWEPGWSPDGRRIIFTGGFIDLPSGVVTNFLGVDRYSISEAQFSPDGRMVAYFSGDGLRIVTVDELGNIGPEVTRLTNVSEKFEWSPDGRRLRFADGFIDLPSGVVTKFLSSANTSVDASRNSDEWKVLWVDQQGHVYVVNSDGTGRIDLGEGEHPQWSPDGKRITYGQTEKFGREVVGQYIFVVNPDGTGKVKIGEGINPRWIPASSW